jgi:hypothetical protein
MMTASRSPVDSAIQNTTWGHNVIEMPPKNHSTIVKEAASHGSEAQADSNKPSTHPESDNTSSQ